MDVMTVWKNIKPKLVDLIQERKRVLENQQKSSRIDGLREQLRPLYKADFPASEDFVKPEMGWHAPAFQEMVEEEDATLPVTQERWNAIKDKAEIQLRQLTGKIYRDVLKRTKEGSLPFSYGLYMGNPFASPSWSEDREDEDTSAIKFASTVVKCAGCHKVLFGARAIHHTYECNSNCLQWLSIRRSVKVAQAVLRAVGMEEDAPVEDVESLEFNCTCGHPDFKLPMSFEKLVSRPALCAIGLSRCLTVLNRCPISLTR
jgi:hypothetical protein